MENQEIIVSFDDVKMKDLRAYWIAIAQGDFEGQDKFFAQVIRSWPYELDPSKPESYGELKFEQFQAAGAAIAAIFAESMNLFAGKRINTISDRLENVT